MRLACSFTVEYVEETTPDQAREARRVIVELMLKAFESGGYDGDGCVCNDGGSGANSGSGTSVSVASDFQG